MSRNGRRISDSAHSLLSDNFVEHFFITIFAMMLNGDDDDDDNSAKLLL